MRFVLLVFALVTFMVGAGILALANSAIHEIEALVLFLITAVFFSGAGVVDSVVHLRKDLGSFAGQTTK
ncbi:MAG: hypothetical protein AABZ12_14065 [Planctomycetota bacterium]